jgi:energy-converting hydrogenase Eha subunit E
MQQERGSENNLSRDDPIVIEIMQRLTALEVELRYLKSDVRLIKYMLFVYIAATVLTVILLRVIP